MAAHRVVEKGRRETPAESRKSELAPVRVAAERQRDASFGEAGPERGIVRERDDGGRRGDRASARSTSGAACR